MINKILKKIYYEKYTNKSYSISNVDLIINRMFSKIKNGIYVDVGCNHPIKYNNTYLLYKRGWRGINIDLDKKSIDEFNLIRNKDYNIQALISSEENINKEIYFYHERSAINTVSKDLIDYRNSKNEDFQIKKQLTSTLNKIIEDSPFKDKKINLISIDIEDHEYEALKNFNFNKYKIDCIVSEIHDYNQEKLEIYNQNIESIINNKLYNMLIENNYKLINWVNSDLIFVRKDFKL
jgi:predicted XRE-type DNA-binding protein